MDTVLACFFYCLFLVSPTDLGYKSVGFLYAKITLLSFKNMLIGVQFWSSVTENQIF